MAEQLHILAARFGLSSARFRAMSGDEKAELFRRATHGTGNGKSHSSGRSEDTLREGYRGTGRNRTGRRRAQAT